MGAQINCSAHQPTFAINGNQYRDGVNYISKGEGSPVILVHGIAASLCDWVKLIPSLVAHEYHAFAPDLLGHGGSSKPKDPEKYHIDSIFSHFSNWIDSLQLDNPIYLVGHSMGGYLSLLYSLQYPQRIGGLVLIDPLYKSRQLNSFLHRARFKPEFGAKIIRYIPEWFINMLLGWDPIDKANFSLYDRQQIANDYKRASPLFVYTAREIPDLTGDINKITAPSLVIWGEKDRTLKANSFPQIVRAMPNATGYIVSGSGHQPHIGQPTLVNNQILAFLDHIRKVDSPHPPM
jgi:pimeloyl-ACP methyl ester carboxylesterase